MKTKLILLFLLCAIPASAIDYNAVGRYWYLKNISTNVPDRVVTIYADGSMYWHRSIPNPPTTNELVVLESVVLKEQQQQKIDPTLWQNQEMAKAITNLILMIQQYGTNISITKFTNTMNKATSVSIEVEK